MLLQSEILDKRYESASSHTLQGVEEKRKKTFKTALLFLPFKKKKKKKKKKNSRGWESVWPLRGTGGGDKREETTE